MVRAFLVVFSAGLAAAATPHPETVAFQKRLIGDVTRGVAAWHEGFLKTRKPGGVADAYALAAMVNLHARTGEAKLLDQAREALVWMAANKETIHGFHTTAYIETYVYLRDHGALAGADRGPVEAIIRKTVRAQQDFPDWGAHNRSVVLATSYYKAAQALPTDPEAGRWRAHGDALMSESWGRWSIEDASMYQSFWFFHLLEGAEASGRSGELMRFIQTRYSFEYYSRLLTPIDLMPDFGDAEWFGLAEWYFANLVRGASYYRDGTYLDFARRFYATQAKATLGGSVLYCAGAALKWLDTTVAPEPLRLDRSEEVLDDLVGKKIVFRSGAARDSAYLLLNYKDALGYGRYSREHVDQVLAAYEEKPHHGHADENAITHLLAGETLLLGDGGYRPLDDYFGGWRADVFHNRVVAREGFPMHGGLWDFLAANKLYRPVRTDKIHFARFGELDYSRTRLRDEDLGYTADRIVLFVPSSAMSIVVDSIRVDRGGHRTFANVWHPENVLRRGDGWVVSWPPRIAVRSAFWENAHNRELLIQFLDRRDKPAEVKKITRRYQPSDAFFEALTNRFFEGQWLTFVTVLQPHAPGGFRDEMLQAVEIIPGSDRDHRSLGLRFAIGGHAATVALKLDRTIGLGHLRGRPLFDVAAGSLDYGEVNTDADFAFVLDKGASREYGLMYASRLKFGGATLFELPAGNSIYQGPGEFRAPDSRSKMPYYRGRHPEP